MDINILLWLQGLREAAGPGVENFFATASAAAVNALFLVIPFAIFWCVDKAKGSVAITSFALGNTVNQLVKNTVCAYRPWVRDSRIVASSKAIEGATGYSFPSGHTLTATTAIGALGWAWRKLVWPLVLTGAFVLVVMFSRLFLGCHTPQDVLVGFVEGCLMIALSQALLSWADAAEGRDRIVLVCGLAFAVAFLVYVTVKPYPMDYADGRLLVDPIEMTVDCYKAGGIFVGFIVGWFLERRFVGFTTDGLVARQRVVRVLVGVVCVLLLHVVIGKALQGALPGPFAGTFVRYCLTFLGGMYVAPALFSAIERRTAKQAA